MVLILFLCLWSGMISFSSNHKHFLLTLLSLEFLVLVFFTFIILFSGPLFSYISLIFITFSACEGALGLSILVDLSRNYGSDFISLLNFS